MIVSTQKIIKIGSSGGVTIPAKELKQQHINIGDEVNVTIEPIQKGDPHTKVLSEYQEFKKTYGETLKNLASR